MNKSDLLGKIEGLINKSYLMPEAQISTFQKFKTVTSIEEDNWDQAVVDTINCIGIQQKKEVELSNLGKINDKTLLAPVLNEVHLGNIIDSQDLKLKLKDLPSEWTVIQISKELRVLDVVGVSEGHRRENPALIITRFLCGDLVDTVPPYLVRIPPSENPLIQPSVTDRILEMKEIRRSRSNLPPNKLKEVVSTFDAQLVSCINEIENYWLREWRYLLTGQLTDRHLEEKMRIELIALVDSIPNVPCKSKAVDLLLQLVINAHKVKETDLVQYVQAALGIPFSTDDLSQHTLKMCVDHVKSTTWENLSAIKKSKRFPVILIIEPSLEVIPWEMTCGISGHPSSRILSLHFLYALFKYHESQVHGGYRSVPVGSGFCLLNPDKSLTDCEKRIGNFLKKELAWMEVIARTVPDTDNVLSCLSNHSLYLYCGHGSGSQYFKNGSLKKALVDSIVLLYGCSSNMPQTRGGRTPVQDDNPYTYLANGCPCTVGALSIVSSTEIDRACIEMLSNMLPTVTTVNGELIVQNPVEPDLLKALQCGRAACLQYWTKSCLVARGLPVKIQFNEPERRSISQLLKSKS